MTYDTALISPRMIEAGESVVRDYLAPVLEQGLMPDPEWLAAAVYLAMKAKLDESLAAKPTNREDSDQ